MKTPQGDRRIRSPLVGRPHVYNMLTASAAASELGYSLDAIVEGLANCVGAPGRFERVPHGGDFAIIVDYAHTDDALLNTLRTAKDLAKGRIITVFGCGGDRDRTKRGPMGRIAGEYSDLVLITSDNPRTEDPLKIIAEIEGSMTTRSVTRSRGGSSADWNRVLLDIGPSPGDLPRCCGRKSWRRCDHRRKRP